MAHVDMEESVSSLQVQRDDLAKKSEMCSVFESGLVELRTMLEKEIEKGQDTQKAWEDLSKLQKKSVARMRAHAARLRLLLRLPLLRPMRLSNCPHPFLTLCLWPSLLPVHLAQLQADMASRQGRHALHEVRVQVLHVRRRQQGPLQVLRKGLLQKLHHHLRHSRVWVQR